MKHSIFTHSLFALCILATGYCGTLSAQAKKAPAAVKKADAKAEAEAKKKAAEAEAKKKAAERRKTINDLVKDMEKRKVRYEQRIDELKKLLAKDEFKAFADSRLQINRQIITFCFPPAWTRISLFDYHNADKELIPAAEAIINDKEISKLDKRYAFEKYVEYLAGKDRHKEAEALAKRSIEFYAGIPDGLVYAYGNLAKAYRYQDRYEDAMKAAQDLKKINPGAGVHLIASVANAFGKRDVIKQAWLELGDTHKMLEYYAKNTHLVDAEIRKIAFDYAMDEKVKPGSRFYIACVFFMGKDEQSRKVRAALKGSPSVKSYNYWNNPINQNYALADYPMVVELCEFFAGSRLMNTPKFQRFHVISLGACGREAEGAKVAAEYAKNDKLSATDMMRLKFYEAILSGKSTDNLMKDTKLTRKEQSQIYLSAARHCLVWKKIELAKKYSKLYESFYAKKQERAIGVKYFETPVKDITAWRKVYPQLEKQYCDIPYKGSMDFLETDVSTGDRGNIKADDKAEMKKFLELTTLCDRYGLHIFLRAEDPNARKIEQGFARGYGCEMYFAPGRNQPYACMGSSAASGVTFIFDTTYNNKNHTRFAINDPKNFRSEVEFTDNDYVLHLFFSWDLYYNKLPAKGSEYRFESLAWGPAGGFSWGGSQGIHAAGSWGSLRFDLTDKQLNEIRKEIIFKTYKSFRNVPRDPRIRENLFQCWADPGIGDPKFYKEYVLPLEQELNQYIKKIKVDMTDADVADVYINALPKMKGLAHEVDQLRRKYLTEGMLED